VPYFPCVQTDHGAHYNPNAIIIATLTFILEVYFMCAAKAWKETDLNTLVLLTKNANIKVVQLLTTEMQMLKHGIERGFSLELLDHQFPEKYRSSFAAG